jgi:hypothetical protein
MARVSKSFSFNQRLSAYRNKFDKPFRIEKSFVDLEEMSENYSHGLIPLVDIADGVKLFVADQLANPVGHKFEGFDLPEPVYADVSKDKVFEHPLFQRNKVPTNVGKIIDMWFGSCAKPGQGVRLPEIYGSLVLSADSGHTNTARIILGEETLPFEVTDIPDQGDFESTLDLAIRVAGEIFLSINNKVVRRPNQFDLFRIAAFQGESPQVNQAEIFKELGFKVKHNGTEAGCIHNLNEITNLWKLDSNDDEEGTYLKRALSWWKRTYPNEAVDGCLTASFGLLMKEQNKIRQWGRKEEDQLGKLLTARWKFGEQAQLALKNAYTTATGGEGYHENNVQVMYGMAQLYNSVYPAKSIKVPKSINFGAMEKV